MSVGTNALVTWRRPTAYVLDATDQQGARPASRQPVRESPVQVLASGAPSGTVIVSGVAGGQATTETLTWAGTAGYRTTSKRWTSITDFTVSLTGSTSVEAKAIGTDGSPQVSLATVRGPGHPVTLERVADRGSPGRTQGTQEEAQDRFLVGYEEVWTPRLGDRVTVAVSGETYEVESVRLLWTPSGMAPERWVCKVKRLDDKAAA